jgi:hypothetical protein
VPPCSDVVGYPEDGGSMVSTKRWYPATSLHGVATQKTATLTVVQKGPRENRLKLESVFWSHKKERDAV